MTFTPVFQHEVHLVLLCPSAFSTVVPFSFLLFHVNIFLNGIFSSDFRHKKYCQAKLLGEINVERISIEFAACDCKAKSLTMYA